LEVLPFLGASWREDRSEARHQFVDCTNGMNHDILGSVQVQDQPGPQAVRGLQPIGPLDDHPRLVVVLPL
jgi:hypothetical protein